MFLSVDFSKAYDNVFHSYLEAFFRYIALPPAMIALLISMFKAPLVFSMGRGIVPEVPLHPGSGIKQGDPLSPGDFRHGTPPPLANTHPLQSPPPPPPGDRHFHVFLVNMYCAGLCCPSALRMALHCFPITSNEAPVCVL